MRATRPRRVLAALSAWAALAGPARAETIRIEVLRGRAQVTVRAAGASFAEGPDAVPVEAPGAEHTVTTRDGALLLGRRVVRAPLLVRPGAAALALDGRAVEGHLEIWSERGGLVVVDVLDLEDYVASVVSSEMPAGWPAAALEAQAVAARTYAVAQKIAQGPGARAHLGSSVLDQVFAGVAGAKSGARRAARETAGLVLTQGAIPIAAYFSASCGGKGESGEDAFGLPAGSAPYLASQDDGDADRGTPRLAWTVRRPLAALSAALRKGRGLRAAVVGLEVTARTASGRARTVRVRTRGAAVSLPAAELRQLVGYNALPSLLFEVAIEGGEAVFRGRGSGHGVGLCQWGARGRAARGEGAREILAHYYPGAELRRMY